MTLCVFDGNIFAVSEMWPLTTSSVVNKPLWTALDITPEWGKVTLLIVSAEASQIFYAIKDTIYQPTSKPFSKIVLDS